MPNNDKNLLDIMGGDIPQQPVQPQVIQPVLVKQNNDDLLSMMDSTTNGSQVITQPIIQNIPVQ